MKWGFWGLLPIVSILSWTGCIKNDSNPIQAEATPPDLAFAGSQSCDSCHAGHYSDFIKSGHPYKVQQINGAAPVYPASTTPGVPNPPAGTSWSDFEYVIGGYGWKARFVLPNGYIYGTGGNGGGQGLNQYNLTLGTWSDYNKTSETKYDYSCFKCHTTGADTLEADTTVYWKPGMRGKFAYAGIQCEECHGKGSQHNFSPEKYPLKTPQSIDCGKCHQRGGLTATVPVKAGFVEHHEQYNEFQASPHIGGSQTLECATCHATHKPLKYGSKVGITGAIRKDCSAAGCHEGKTVDPLHSGMAKCVTCHMAYTGKSSSSKNKYTGDVSSHIVKIYDAAVPKDSMFTDGAMTGTGSIKLVNGKAPGITLDFVCYSCHQDSNGVGGTYSQKSLTELQAKDMHP